VHHGEVLQRPDVTVNRIAAASHLLLEDSKHERLILWDCRRKIQEECGCEVGQVARDHRDESLSLREHWTEGVKKARQMLGQLSNSQWGIRATSWRSIYHTGMIRVVAMWRSELGW